KETSEFTETQHHPKTLKTNSKKYLKVRNDYYQKELPNKETIEQRNQEEIKKLLKELKNEKNSLKKMKKDYKEMK
ncbi:1327_t:CDS:1, partial [Racocetra fulgida]